MKYTGSCHCGKNQYEVEGELTEVVECNCSICQRNGYMLWFVPRGMLTLKTPESNLRQYTFNKHIIKHCFCTECGGSVFGLGRMPDGSPIAAINARCLENVDLAALKKTFYNGKDI